MPELRKAFMSSPPKALLFAMLPSVDRIGAIAAFAEIANAMALGR